MAFLAVFEGFLVGFVGELYTFFQFHDISGTCCASKCNYSK